MPTFRRALRDLNTPRPTLARRVAKEFTAKGLHKSAAVYADKAHRWTLIEEVASGKRQLSAAR